MLMNCNMQRQNYPKIEHKVYIRFSMKNTPEKLGHKLTRKS